MAVKCNYCGNIISEDDLYCMFCGKPVIENRCEDCDILLPENARYCYQCGGKSSFKKNGLLSSVQADIPEE